MNGSGLLTKKDFVNAAKLLETAGHLKRRYGGLPEGYCAAGALGQASLGDPSRLSISSFPDRVYEVLDYKGYKGEGAIMEFNDKRSTTKEDAQTLLLLLGEIAAGR